MKTYENLLVVQTFKIKIIRAAVSVMYGSKLIAYLNDCKYSFNSYDGSAYHSSWKASMEDEPYFTEQVRRIIDTREWAKE